MRIAQVAPPWEPVPPSGYGGTERVVDILTQELVAAGHDVTLFASGDSRTDAELVPVTPVALRPAGIRDAAPAMIREAEMVRRHLADFDVVHGHIDYFAFSLGAEKDLPPAVHTMHGRLDIPSIAPVFETFRDRPLVSISDTQRAPMPDQNWVATIHHGLPLHKYRPHLRPGGYALFLGRMGREKRPDWAIEIARRAGVLLVMAAKVDWNDQEFFDEAVRPLLARGRDVEFIGEVTDERKNDLIGGAVALLMPIDWPEPFGLTAIEALACGTPVLGRPCGALPELITDGVDGFLRNDVNELADLLANRIGDIDRADCRRTFETRFTAHAMANKYVAVYERLLDGQDKPRSAAKSNDEWVTVDNALVASIPKHALKGNHAYAVFDTFGDIPGNLHGEFGFYNRGTRYVSDLEIEINGTQPCLLASGYDPQSHTIVVDLGNEHFVLGDGMPIQQNAVHVRRELRIEDDALRQTLTVRNFAGRPLRVTLALVLDTDFADLFEVRGTVRPRRGEMLPPEIGMSGGTLAYRGRDAVRRMLQFVFDRPATSVEGNRFDWTVDLDPREEWSLDAKFTGRALSRSRFRVLGAAEKLDKWTDRCPRITTDDETLTSAVRQAFCDLGELMSMGADGLFPTAGIPWYATLFGRDSIITALQLIPWRVDTAVSTFFTLAHFQASSHDDFTDREPGKILHEWREGEMANTREIPFIPYYGTADATPLFIHLAHEIYAATGDRLLLARMWPHVLRACEWIEESGSIAGDGLIDYERRSPIGLRNQGWKDSNDSISHVDGELAEGPIALIEVQAYTVAALREASALALLMGDSAPAVRYASKAEAIRDAMKSRFWMDHEGTYGLALDGNRRLCEVVASNAGHALFAGAVAPERAHSIAARLLRDDVACGFGIRTLSSGARRFNPMSYHNGSVWPHDNILIADGFRRYGLLDEMSCVHRQLMTAIRSFSLHRIPELYCGFGRDVVAQPVSYPTACAPQAWASATILGMIRQMTGLTVDGHAKTISFDRITLPAGVNRISIEGLTVGDEQYDFTVRRTSVEVHRGGSYAVMAGNQ